jgi:hypothetical protein
LATGGGGNVVIDTCEKHFSKMFSRMPFPITPPRRGGRQMMYQIRLFFHLGMRS